MSYETVLLPKFSPFGKRTVSYFIYFLSYPYFDIWPSPDNYDSPSTLEQFKFQLKSFGEGFRNMQEKLEKIT